MIAFIEPTGPKAERLAVAVEYMRTLLSPAGRATPELYRTMAARYKVTALELAVAWLKAGQGGGAESG